MAIDVEPILEALETSAGDAFHGITSDLEKHIFPALAGIAKSIVAIAADVAAGEISESRAKIELRMARNAAEAWIVGFVEATLERIQGAINATLRAAAEVINRAVGFALL